MSSQFILQAMRDVENMKQVLQNTTDIVNDSQAPLLRFQIQKILQEILILDLEYALSKKVEHDLWNFGCKMYVDALQKLIACKKNPKRGEYTSLLTAFLEEANGFYLSLLEDVCVTFSEYLPFNSYRKEHYFQSHGKKSRIQQFVKKPGKEACYYICQHCLVHLGDVARYKRPNKQAEKFYRHAILLCPDAGQPYNQLALLETSRGNKLATVYYYMRSATAKLVFPAAFVNLSITFDKITSHGQEIADDGLNVLSASDFVANFLKFHAFLHADNEAPLEAVKCGEKRAKVLITSLTAHVAMESFTTTNLCQAMVINMCAYHRLKQLPDKSHLKRLLVEFMAGCLNAFLLPVYTFKEADDILQYSGLPSIKIMLDWIRGNSEVLGETGFTNRPQIWPAYCSLTSKIRPVLAGFDIGKYAADGKDVALPEDQDLQGFLPLHEVIPEFKYENGNSELDLDLDVLSKIRGYYVEKFGHWLANSSFPLIKFKKDASARCHDFEPITECAPDSGEIVAQMLQNALTIGARGGGSGGSGGADNDEEGKSKGVVKNGGGSRKEKLPGILKCNKGLESVRSRLAFKKSDESTEKDSGKEEPTKQVTFRTPSPSSLSAESGSSELPNSLDFPSTPPLSQSRIWGSEGSSSLSPATGLFPSPNGPNLTSSYPSAAPGNGSAMEMGMGMMRMPQYHQSGGGLLVGGGGGGGQQPPFAYPLSSRQPSSMPPPPPPQAQPGSFRQPYAVTSSAQPRFLPDFTKPPPGLNHPPGLWQRTPQQQRGLSPWNVAAAQERKSTPNFQMPPFQQPPPNNLDASRLPFVDRNMLRKPPPRLADPIPPLFFNSPPPDASLRGGARHLESLPFNTGGALRQGNYKNPVPQQSSNFSQSWSQNISPLQRLLDQQKQMSQKESRHSNDGNARKF